MSKAAEMAKVSVKGGFNLLWGLVASNLISAAVAVVMARLLMPDAYGVYTVALAGPNLINNFRDWGINSAMIRYEAHFKAEDKMAEVKRIFASGLIFEVVLGVVLSLVSFALSGVLATNIFNRPTIAPLIEVGSFVILTGALLNTAQAAFTGVEKMHLTSITLIIQAIAKAVLIPGLLLLGLGAAGAVTGYIVSFLIAGIAGVLLMYVLYRDFPRPENGRLELVENIKMMFKYGFPLSIAAIVSNFVATFYSTLMAIYTANALIGNYSAGLNFIVLITFFATPITTMLFPAFSKLDPEKDRETLKNVFQFSIKYSSVLVVPSAAVIMALSQPAVSTLFGNTYADAPLFLTLLAISYLFTAIGNLSIPNLINGQGQTKFNLKITLIASGIGVPLAFVLIPKFGVIGLIVTSTVSVVPGLIISLIWLRNRYGVTVDWLSSAKILLSAAIAAAVTYVLISQIGFSSWIRLIIGLIIFIPVYVLAAVGTRTVNKGDLISLRQMTAGLGPLSGLVNSFLNIIEKLMKALKST